MWLFRIFRCYLKTLEANRALLFAKCMYMTPVSYGVSIYLMRNSFNFLNWINSEDMSILCSVSLNLFRTLRHSMVLSFDIFCFFFFFEKKTATCIIKRLKWSTFLSITFLICINNFFFMDVSEAVIQRIRLWITRQV